MSGEGRQAGKQPRLACWLGTFALRMGAGEWRSTFESTCIAYDSITSFLSPGFDGRKHYAEFMALQFRRGGGYLRHRARPDHAIAP